MRDGDAPIESTPLTIGHTIRRWARWYDLVSWIISLGRIHSAPDRDSDRAARA